MASPRTVMLIIGLILLLISAILLWIGIATRNKEEKESGGSVNDGWWWIFIGTVIFFLGLFALFLSFVLPKSKKTNKSTALEAK